MYKYQNQLPMLPVPSLQETCEKYMKTVQPLLKSDEERKRTQKAVHDFLNGSQAAELQARLLQRKDQVTAAIAIFITDHVFDIIIDG
jgi:carnitine O-acetyltransferase